MSAFRFAIAAACPTLAGDGAALRDPGDLVILDHFKHPPPVREEEPRTQRTANAVPHFRRTFQAADFGRRWAIALRKRLHPNTTLTVAQFAYKVGVSERTAWLWLSGNEPRGRYVITAMSLFDSSFMTELVGREVSRVSDIKDMVEALQEKLDETRAIMEGRIA